MMTHCIVLSKKNGQWYKNGEVYSSFEKDTIALLDGSPYFMKHCIFAVYGAYFLKRYRK